MLLQFTACKDSGSVGDSIGPPQTQVTVDTTRIDSLRGESLNAFSGNPRYLSVGGFQDPLFGDIKVRGLLKPALVAPDSGVVIGPNSRITLRLGINPDLVYGDTTGTATFDVVEIGELWRAPAWHFKDDIKLVQGGKVGSFSVKKQDSIDVELSSDWVQKYGTYFNRTDSTRFTDYRRNFYGLALVSTNDSKIIAIDPNDTKFIAFNLNNETDTSRAAPMDIGFQGVASSINRSHTSFGNDEAPIYNTLESVLHFNFDFSSNNIEAQNISNVELVIKRDKALLSQSLDQAGPNVVRPMPDSLYLHFISGEDLPLSLDPGSPLSNSRGIEPGTYKAKDNAYHYNLTAPIVGQAFDFLGSSFSFYITTGTNNGLIRSDLLFDSRSDTKSPKLIITSTKNR